MLIGVFSDLHGEFRDWYYNFRPDVVYINAGDTATCRGGMGGYLRQRLKKDIENVGSVYLDISGNHDYYGGVFPLPGEGQFKWRNIAGATLWTDMTPLEFLDYKRSMSDASFISGTTYESYLKAHASDLKFLKDSKADIIVTHHSPTHQSISDKWRGDPLNKFFHNNLDNLIEELSPKLWIHGHTHDPQMYTIGKTRIICNPRGYPHENSKKYQPVYLEV